MVCYALAHKEMASGFVVIRVAAVGVGEHARIKGR